ncbi:hypothetical protein ACHAWF_003177 [Thalassiosira exigua]
MRVHIHPAIIVALVGKTNAFNHALLTEIGTPVGDENRRQLFGMLITAAVAKPTEPSIDGIGDSRLRGYHSSSFPNWEGSSLPGPLSLAEACSQISDNNMGSEPLLRMGRWPDPILRHQASPIPTSVFRKEDQLKQLQVVANSLRNTARREGAVGLAAQQCGVDGSLIFIDGVKNPGTDVVRRITKGMSGRSISVEGANKQPRSENHSDEEGTFLVNPRIIHRSPESQMLVWTEECLVLPPEFRATLLRDAEVTIECECLELFGDAPKGSCGFTKQIKLQGELARCAQHEMDHDNGILIVDHVALDELLSINGNMLMADIENADGLHSERMQRAYSRGVSGSILLSSGDKNVPEAIDARLWQTDREYMALPQRRPPLVQYAYAADEAIPPNATSSTLESNESNTPLSGSDRPVCDSNCQEERRRLVEQRRAMMKQSRSNTRRADVLELSQQRASLYGSDFKGLPPQYCRQPSFCP